MTQDLNEKLLNVCAEIQVECLVHLDDYILPEVNNRAKELKDFSPEIREILFEFLREGFKQGVEIGVLHHIKRTGVI